MDTNNTEITLSNESANILESLATALVSSPVNILEASSKASDTIIALSESLGIFADEVKTTINMATKECNSVFETCKQLSEKMKQVASDIRNYVQIYGK